MEMRRHARSDGNPGDRPGTASQGRVERVILTAYWLVSGYGLRAWRAMAWLALVTALLAVAFHLVGFAIPPQPSSYWTNLPYAFRATLSPTDDHVTLIAWGQPLQAVLRLTGAVLLGPGPARPPRTREALSDPVKRARHALEYDKVRSDSAPVKTSGRRSCFRARSCRGQARGSRQQTTLVRGCTARRTGNSMSPSTVIPARPLVPRVGGMAPVLMVGETVRKPQIGHYALVPLSCDRRCQRRE
jgi:hypothetical protein